MALLHTDADDAHTGEDAEEASTSGGQSIHSMTTEQWRQQFEADGYVDLWLEEEFNAGSRLVVSSASQRSDNHLHLLRSFILEKLKVSARVSKVFS